MHYLYCLKYKNKVRPTKKTSKKTINNFLPLTNYIRNIKRNVFDMVTLAILAIF